MGETNGKTLRLRVTSDTEYPHSVKVVDADTGEEITNATHVRVEASATEPFVWVSITLADAEIDVVGLADVEDASSG